MSESKKVLNEEEQSLKILKQREKSFNGLSAKEWTSLSKSVWNDISLNKNSLVTPEGLCDRLIQIYSKKGDTILDPFMGSGTACLSAINNGRNSVGIELEDSLYNYAQEAVSSLNNSEANTRLIKGNCCECIKELEDNSFQLVITAPPHADIVSKKMKENKEGSASLLNLGEIGLRDFFLRIEGLMRELYRVVKPGGYNVWIVKDFRDTKNNMPYISIHAFITTIAEMAGFVHHDLIVWDPASQRNLVASGFPSVFYANLNHSFIVVTRKPK